MHSNNYTNNLFTIGDVTLNSSDTLQVIDIGESIYWMKFTRGCLARSIY